MTCGNNGFYGFSGRYYSAAQANGDQAIRQISGLTWWTAARFESYAAGDAVGVLHDQVSGNNAVQSTAISKPAFRMGGPNNMPYVEFDTSNDFMLLSSGIALSKR